MGAKITFFCYSGRIPALSTGLKSHIWDIRFFYLPLQPKYGVVRGCGEIWLLATTLKNAKMLTSGHLGFDRRVSIFCFSVRSAFLWGFFVARSSPTRSGTNKEKYKNKIYELSIYIRVSVRGTS